MENVKIYGSIVEDEARKQIERVASMDAFKDAKIRIMPDVHAGKGCVCGFTADLGDKVVPNLIGVDIGCGVTVANLGDQEFDLKKLDEVIRAKVPVGQNVNRFILSDIDEFYSECDPDKCHIAFDNGTLSYFKQSMGSLGSGNHFISVERSDDGTNYLLVHTGSRNLGKQVCDIWQKTAIKRQVEDSIPSLGEEIERIKKECYANGERNGIHNKILEAKKKWKEIRDSVGGNEDLAFLTGTDRQHYIDDMRLCQKWAEWNRLTIVRRICKAMDLEQGFTFDTKHNYLGSDNIIRKSAISARRGEMVVIPMNMRDGSLLCVGLGNADWNYSAPHGAGRIMSRAKAKKKLNLASFQRSMRGIYTTSCVAQTLDEAPDAYKPMDVIMSEISETVSICDVIKPIYNFKGYDVR